MQQDLIFGPGNTKPIDFIAAFPAAINHKSFAGRQQLAHIAQRLGLPLEPFVLAVLFGGNMSFMTPMGYQTNLLVMSAGNYSFSDFVKVGAPLTVLMWLTLTWVLAALYLQ